MRGLRLPSVRELVLVALFLLAGDIAFRLFDEWRPALKVIVRGVLVGAVVFFAGRAFWSWWKTQPVEVAAKRAGIGIAFAVAGWLGVALARAVAGMSGENYALIVIAPLTMLLGALMALGGALAAGLGLAVIATGLTRPVSRPALVVAAGLACFLLNAGHVVALASVYWGA